MKEETAEGDKEIKVEFIQLDLSSFQSTTDFVQAFKEKNLPLHILINNAALFAVPYGKTQMHKKKYIMEIQNSLVLLNLPDLTNIMASKPI